MSQQSPFFNSFQSSEADVLVIKSARYQVPSDCVNVQLVIPTLFHPRARHGDPFLFLEDGYSGQARIKREKSEIDLSKIFISHLISSMEQTITLRVQADAKVTLWLHDQAQQVTTKKQIITYHIILEKAAQVTCLLGLLHSNNLELKLYFYLQGIQAKLQAFGVYALSDQQNIEIKTYQMHQAPDTQSQLLLKGMVKDKAQARIEGLIYIDEVASKADASQENKNIVCSPQAHVVSIPSIEVKQHDVQCCHGSAVGQFDQKHLWYLQSRGLNYDQAHRLLIASFFGTVVKKFENGQQFMEMICQKMI